MRLTMSPRLIAASAPNTSLWSSRGPSFVDHVGAELTDLLLPTDACASNELLHFHMHLPAHSSSNAPSPCVKFS